MKMKVSMPEVLQVFEGVLAGDISGEKAEDWAYIRMETLDNLDLIFEPASAKDFIWDGLLDLTGEYLHDEANIKTEFERLIEAQKNLGC